MNRRWWSALLLAVLTIAGLPGGSALAHATMIGSSLLDGSVVAEAPAEVTIGFDEAILLDASSATLLHVADSTVDDLELTSADGGSSIVAALPADLPIGPYILRFTVLDPADLHRTVGSISFGVGVAAPPSVSGGQLSVPWWATVARSAGDTTMLLGGGCAVLLLVAGRLLVSVDRRRVARWSQWAALATVVAWLIVLLADAADVGWSNVSWGSLLIRSDPGRRFVVGTQLALGLWWTRSLVDRAQSAESAGTDAADRFLTRVIAGLWAAMVLLAALGGHSGIGGSAWVGTPLRFAHLAALSAWLGTVAITAIVLRSRASEPAAVWHVVSRTAAIGLAVAGASGLLLSGRVVETVTALFTTRYGRLLVAKSVGLVVLGIAGFVAARRVSAGRSPSLRLLAPELVVGVVLVGAAALLAGSAPARGEQFLPLEAVAPQVVTSDSSDLLVSASVDPAYPGANLVTVRALDTRRPVPGPIADVEVTFLDGSGAVVATRNGVPVDGVIEWSGVDLPAPGELQIVVAIDRPALEVPEYRTLVTVSVPPVPRVDIVVSDRNWAPFAVLGAAAWLVLVVLARRIIIARDQRRSSPGEGPDGYPGGQHV